MKKLQRYSVDVSGPLAGCSYEDDNGNYVNADQAEQLQDELVSSLGGWKHMKGCFEFMANKENSDWVQEQIELCDIRINLAEKVLGINL